MYNRLAYFPRNLQQKLQRYLMALVALLRRDITDFSLHWQSN